MFFFFFFIFVSLPLSFVSVSGLVIALLACPLHNNLSLCFRVQFLQRKMISYIGSLLLLKPSILTSSISN